VRLRRTTAALLAIAASPFVGVGAASAAEITVVDSVGDVRMYDGGPGGYEVAPEVTNGDFASVTYRHRLHRVVLRAEYVDLVEPQSSPDDGSFVFASRMRTNEDVYRVAYTAADASAPEGQSILFSRRDQVRCDVGQQIDYEANWIKVSIPRSCLSRPSWVRFTSYHGTFGGAETYDQPHDDGAEPTAWTSKVRHA